MVTSCWTIKNICGFALVAYAVAAVALRLEITPILAVPLRAAQALALAGGAITVWHYLLLREHARRVNDPVALVSSGGLYGLVRHPMYLGDLLLFTGLALFTADLTAMVFLAAGAGCLLRQGIVEDRLMAQRFGEAHRAWSEKTRLMIPWLF